jgi:hypothetical protein
MNFSAAPVGVSSDSAVGIGGRGLTDTSHAIANDRLLHARLPIQGAILARDAVAAPPALTAAIFTDE